MTTEPKTRANPDYSKSAVYISNPPEVLLLLACLHEVEREHSRIKAEMAARISIELNRRLEVAESKIDHLKQDIKYTVQRLGGYQDIDTGTYALEQVRQSWEWKPEALKREYPKWAVPLIVESVDVRAAEAQIGKGLPQEQELKDKGVIVAGKTTTAWVIKTGQESK